MGKSGRIDSRQAQEVIYAIMLRNVIKEMIVGLIMLLLIKICIVKRL